MSNNNIEEDIKIVEERIKALNEIKKWRNYIVKNREKVNRANDIEFYLRTVLNLIEKQSKEIEDSISKELVENKLNEIQDEYELLLEHQSGKESNRTKYLRGKIHMCQELLIEGGIMQ